MANPLCCSICEVQAASFCPACVQNSIAERRRRLKAAAARRDATKERLNKRLAAVGAADDQRRWRIEWAEARMQLQVQIRKLTDEVAKGIEKLERRKRNVKIRSSQLKEAKVKLYNERNEVLAQYCSDVLRSESLRQTFICSELARLRRQTIQKLRSVLPLKVTLIDVGSSMRQYVTICGIRLPDGTEPAIDSGPELSAALGYLLQFVGMASTYLAAPILHVAGHGVSSSSIWQRESYWKTKSSTGSYPLYLPRTGSATASRSGSLYSSLTSDKKPLPVPEAAPSADPPLSKAASETRAVSQLKQGIALLRRSVACLCSQQWAASGLPRDAATRSPFFGLAVLMAVLADGEGGGLLQPEAQCASDMTAPESLAAVDGTASWQQASFTRQAGFAMAEQFAKAAALAGPHKPVTGHEVGLSKQTRSAEGRSARKARRAPGAGHVKDADLDGWDIVDRPADILPPPPSEPDNIAHWTRAMFLDARK